MAVDYDKIMAMKSEPGEGSFNTRDVMLYALGIGFGRDPLDQAELDYVYEKNLKTMPTMAVVLTMGAGGRSMLDTGLNYLLMLHGEQRLTLNRPLPTSGTIVGQGRIVGLYDKGKDKGALLVNETTLRLKDTGEELGTVGMTGFFRGDGGFGGPSEGAPVPHPLPERRPDHVTALETRPDQAALYRLSGDYNPLHIDPAIAKQAGYDRPILHGLCTYGTACRAILKTVCAYDHTMIRGFDVRFSAPVFPGETIVTEMWQDGKIVSFRCKVKERDIVVINNGKCTLA